MSLISVNLQGLDRSWMGIDDFGHVGIFFTGGEGPIPPAAIVALNAQLEIEQQIELLPIHTQYELRVRYHRPDDFISATQRGIFAFDWSDVHRSIAKLQGSYELIASPLDPITIDKLPISLQEYANSARICGSNFVLCSETGVAI